MCDSKTSAASSTITANFKIIKYTENNNINNKKLIKKSSI